ncbi:hypothetical protein SO802_024092 [Lithocarpus litseifolius]|uniref:Uncharacterized protein n=1 Tax=Lithocarpus litseifolius TaxID=425828 RepID=A0AAW2C867_9ROSI
MNELRLKRRDISAINTAGKCRGLNPRATGHYKTRVPTHQDGWFQLNIHLAVKQIH